MSSKVSRWLGIRHLQFFLIFIAVFFSWAIRTTLSIAILAMTSTNPPTPNIPIYPEWNNTDIILSSFFWGYMLLQLFAGQLSERFGPKWFLVASMALLGIFTITLPFAAATFGSYGVIFCRFLQGLVQGFLYPTCHTLMSKWAPVSDRSKIVSFTYGGYIPGVIVSMLASGAICESNYGWPWCFYMFGSFAIVWAFLWAWLGSNTPEEHPWISDEEKKYILANTENSSKEKLATPWRRIFTSMPVYAITIASCAFAWCGFTLLTQIPSYLEKMMNFKLSANSQLSTLPYWSSWLVCLTVPSVGDWMIKRGFFSIVTTRKIIECLGKVTPAIALFILAFFGPNEKTLAIVLLVIANGFEGSSYGGFIVNIIDIAPNHAGTLLGLTNGFSQICSILGPMSVDWIPYEKTDPMCWRYVFCIAGGFNVIAIVFYLIFAEGETQSWNHIDEIKKEDFKTSGKL